MFYFNYVLSTSVVVILTKVSSLITLFLYMVSELSALQQIVNALTGLNGLPAVIVQVVVTTIYTSLGGFRVSFVTDNIQGVMVLGLIIIAVITVGTTTEIDRSSIDESGFLKASLLGWQLIYILPVAVLTNDFFLSNFWLRTFASRTDRDLRIAVSIASFAVLCILVLVGATGLLAAWSGAWPGDPPQEGSIAFFLLLEKLPSWVVGIVLVMTVALSTAAFDSFQSAMVSTASNDIFRNKLPLIYVRIGVVLCIIPVIVVALKSPSVLQIFLISDLVSAAAIPVLMLGLWDKLYFWQGFEVVVGGLGGILSIWIFGTVYYSDPYQGGQLILLENGLYADDWSAFGSFLLSLSLSLSKTIERIYNFRAAKANQILLSSRVGAFVAAPVGGFIFGVAALIVRLTFQFILAKYRGRRFDALDKTIQASQPPSLLHGTASGGAFTAPVNDSDFGPSSAAAPYGTETEIEGGKHRGGTPDYQTFGSRFGEDGKGEPKWWKIW